MTFGFMYSVQLKISRSPSIFGRDHLLRDLLGRALRPDAAARGDRAGRDAGAAEQELAPAHHVAHAVRCRTPPGARRARRRAARRRAGARARAPSPDRRRARAARRRRSTRRGAGRRRRASRALNSPAAIPASTTSCDPGVVARVEPGGDRSQLRPARGLAPQLQPQPPLAIAHARERQRLVDHPAELPRRRSSPRRRRSSCGSRRAARTSARAPPTSSASRVAKW